MSNLLSKSTLIDRSSMKYNVYIVNMTTDSSGWRSAAEPLLLGSADMKVRAEVSTMRGAVVVTGVSLLLLLFAPSPLK